MTDRPDSFRFCNGDSDGNRDEGKKRGAEITQAGIIQKGTLAARRKKNEEEEKKEGESGLRSYIN